MSDTRTRSPTRPRGAARCAAHEAPRAIAAHAETERPSAELPSKKKEGTARRVVSNPRRSISIARLSPPHHPGLKKRALLGPGSGFIKQRAACTTVKRYSCITDTFSTGDGSSIKYSMMIGSLFFLSPPLCARVVCVCGWGIGGSRGAPCPRAPACMCVYTPGTSPSTACYCLPACRLSLKSSTCVQKRHFNGIFCLRLAH